MSQFKYNYDQLKPRKIVVTQKAEIGILETSSLTWHTTNGKKIWDFKAKGLTDVDVTDDGATIVLGAFGNQLNVLTHLGKIKFQHTIRDVSIECVKFSHNGERIAVTGFEPYLALLDTEYGAVTWKTNYADGSLVSMVFDQKDRLLAIIGADRMAQIFDVTPKKEQRIYRIFPMRDNGMLVCNKDNYYTATRDAIENLAFSYQSSIYTCDQFDLYFNRPDLIVADSPYKDDDYLSLLTAAYEKRVKSVKSPNAMSNTISSQVEIVNLGEFANYVTSQEITLVVSAKDSVNALQNLQIWLNGVPLYGKTGKRISGKNYTDSITIDLVSGANNIKIAATNTMGMESLKSTMHVNYENQKKPNLYIACIGVSDYQDNRFDLKYAAKDAKDFMAAMEKSVSFGTINKKLLTDGAATKENISALKAFFEQAQRDDVVILFVAGHGVLDKNFDYYYATNDIDFENPSAKGLAYLELEKVLDQIKAIKKLLLMDTCHSGELDKEDVKEDMAVNNEKDPNIIFRTAGAKLSTSKSAHATSLLVKELFADIRQNSGTTVISSSSGLEFSMESEQWKNGLFTYCLINGLQSKLADLDRDGFISVGELQEYIKNAVYEKSGGRQIPTFRVQNIEMDFKL